MQGGKVISTLITTLFMMTCAVTVFDTHSFVYPSLSRSLLMEAGMLVCGLVVFLTLILKSPADYADFTDNKNSVRTICSMRGSERSIRGSKIPRIYVLAWIAYIIVHGWLSPVTEWYRIIYLCVMLLGIIILSYAVRAGLLLRRHMVGILLFGAVAQVVAVFSQWLGFMEAEDALYPITGFSDNPNVTAMYLVGCVPFAVRRMVYSQRHGAYALFLLLVVVSVMLLRCRTAYIGLAVEVCVFLLIRFSPTDTSDKRRLSFGGNKSLKICAICVTIVLTAVFVGKLYDMKRDSADGRLLIWRLSAQMIAEHPTGHGYGLFAKHYNLRQAEYFAKEHGTETERRTATFVGMAYNDYLEHGVDGGVIGMLLLIGFYTLLIRYAYRQRNTAATSVLTAFAVMSLVNFVIAGIQTWLLVVCTAAMVLGNENRIENKIEDGIENKIEDGNWTGRLLHNVQGMLFLVFTMLLSIVVYRMTSAQYRLCTVEHRLSAGETVSDSVFADIGNDIFSSEAFWRIRAENAMNGGKTQQSCTYAKEALQYTSVPELFLLCSRGCQQSGKTDDAVCSLTTASQMQPSRLYPKLYLMRLYASTGRDDEALEAAADIMRTEIKVRSREARLIRREAYEYIKSKQQ